MFLFAFGDEWCSVLVVLFELVTGVFFGGVLFSVRFGVKQSAS